MHTITASVPAKIILFGEHAVVYGQPAVAVPVLDVRAHAEMIRIDERETAVIHASDLEIQYEFAAQKIPSKVKHIDEAMRFLIRQQMEIPETGWRLDIRSDIPIGRGMGSSAAISVLLIRIMHQFVSIPLAMDDLIRLSYELEKYHHGTPSGVDNTVVATSQPVYFIKGEPFELLEPAQFHLVIGDCGIGKKTGDVVADVASAYKNDEKKYGELFQCIGDLARFGRLMLENGDHEGLGAAMNSNQTLLRQINVSCDELENLISAALSAGACGAKLCGAGRGGCMVALAKNEQHAGKVKQALDNAGAANSFYTRLKQEFQ
ncbi:mevalonate kinase [candidate division KSB1 bacterium]|nr:mevalonate kinase [candidate division KSB1 bacterium]